ncbi:helix-turn-helix domain-containing protein [Actinacidiphila sp. bgisy145]|uniref:helix-turn-helix domain-containing protein n=1 Tax=Actinacidiphila sp. bgisy145 TaxID=3413792 RepID=UPI003EC111FA
MRRTRPAASQPSSPLWVRAFTATGRPAVALAVLGMCAPGEHHLAELAGWSSRLAWGMAAVLAAYAGIAAAVAGARPAGAPGKASAVIGAAISLTAAAAAQPVSHLFVTGWLTASPRPPIALVITVSCVPPLVLGHLLHLAATPVPAPAVTAPEPGEQTAETTETDSEPDEQPQPDDDQDKEPGPDGPSGGFLTTAEVAARYGVKPSTVGTWVQRGRLAPAFKDPGLGNMYDPAQLPPVVNAAS